MDKLRQIDRLLHKEAKYMQKQAPLPSDELFNRVMTDAVHTVSSRKKATSKISFSAIFGGGVIRLAGALAVPVTFGFLMGFYLPYAISTNSGIDDNTGIRASDADIAETGSYSDLEALIWSSDIDLIWETYNGG